MFFLNINLWAVLAAAIASMAVGFIWYSPWTFGTLWQKAGGWSDEDLKVKKEARPMWLMYSLSFVLAFVTAFVIASIFNSLVVIGFSGMFVTAALLWIGFIVPLKLNDVLFGDDSIIFFLITAGHQFVSLVIMTFVVGIWG